MEMGCSAAVFWAFVGISANTGGSENCRILGWMIRFFKNYKTLHEVFDKLSYNRDAEAEVSRMTGQAEVENRKAGTRDTAEKQALESAV
jgi:hypothetical protein